MSRPATVQRHFLFVQSTTEQGGAETVLLNALSADSVLRQKSLVVTLGFGEGDLPVRLRTQGAEVVELPRARLRSPLGVIRRAAEIAKTAKKHGVRVVIGNGAHPQIFGALAARMARVRTAYFVHMIHEDRLLKNPAIDVLAVRGPLDLALANSAASLESMRRLRPDVRVELLYPGTPVATSSTMEASQARATLGILPSEVLFGIFGRLQRWKGQDVFLEAAAQVAIVLPEARFLVVGGAVFGLEPEFDHELRVQAVQLGIADKVFFLGQRTDVAALMAACDVVCHATRTAEPFGMVLVEAMAQGRPVVATRGGGPSEIVVEGETGFLAAPGDPADMAERMKALGASPEQRARMGAASLARARTSFSSEAFAGRLRHLLEDL
jgi:glycosyltransferase involved in cell wall biosynthesis